MDIVEELKKMSQWIWITEDDLRRNKISKLAYLEIVHLRQRIKELESRMHCIECGEQEFDADCFCLSCGRKN